MKENKLLKISFWLVFTSLFVLLILNRLSLLSYKGLYSVYLPAVFTTVNFIIVAASIEKSYKKPFKNVLNSFLLWMGIRVAILILLVIISLKFLDINQNSFIFSTLFYYIYYLIIEVIFIIIKES